MKDRILTGTGIPKQFLGIGLEDYDSHPPRGHARVFDAVNDWEPSDEKPALVLYGRPGTGKTMMASAVLNSYHADLSFGRLGGVERTVMCQRKYPVYFVQMADLIQQHIECIKLHDDALAGFREPDEYLELDKFLKDLVERVQVLVIDDVGKEHKTRTGFAEDVFDLIVRKRHNASLPTIYTTNLLPRKWSDEYSASMLSLIQRSSVLVDFEDD